MLKSAAERDKEARPFEKEIKAFGEIIKNDKALLDKLDRTLNQESFIAEYCRLAAEKGIHFTPADMAIAVQEQKHGSQWVVPSTVLRMFSER